MNKNDPDTTGIKIIPPVYVVSAIVIGVVLNILFPTPYLATITTGVVGGMLVLISIVFSIWAIRGQKKAGTTIDVRTPTTYLVTQGAYQFSRNPMYLGSVIFMMGIGLAFSNSWILISVPIVILILTKQIILPEEQYLKNKFGQEFSNYCSKVRRWI